MSRLRNIALWSICTLFLLPAPAQALSCLVMQELNYLFPLMSKGPNVVEAVVDKVTVDEVNKSIHIEVSTTEVFNGEPFERYTLTDMSSEIAGAPRITRCDESSDIHVQLDKTEYKGKFGVRKERGRRNALSGFPKHNCGHYKNLIGKNVVLFDFDRRVICMDGIIEIENLQDPSALRSYLRCASNNIEYIPRIPSDLLLKGDSERASPELSNKLKSCPRPFSD
jgi:hypothetical protein